MCYSKGPSGIADSGQPGASAGVLHGGQGLGATRAGFELYWKADTRPLHQTIDAILAQRPDAIASAADIWFSCALAERDPAAAERALVALGDNPCSGESAIILSRSFGEGLLARMTKDEARVVGRVCTGYAAARQRREVWATINPLRAQRNRDGIAEKLGLAVALLRKKAYHWVGVPFVAQSPR